ncbi:Sas10/Utp3/C1D family [Euphorbia peplus]|nr:Sas10/Utp3/C1D family [Euphorbia peplus]
MMVDKSYPEFDQIIKKDSVQLAALLKEMKDGLDAVTNKVEGLTAKVKASNFGTADGISYLEAKHLLLLNYCQSLVYYLLRKAKGLSIEKHPVVLSLVEIRLFLEKIRPIDKKMEYQIQKLTKDSVRATEEQSVEGNESKAHEKSEDLLKYRPNPDILVPKTDSILKDDDVYRPPKIAPTVMEEDRLSKQERNALRRDIQTQRDATKQGYMKDLIHEMEGKPEEVKEDIGNESREFTRYKQQWEERARQEEELFTRAPITRMEKKKEKHLLKSKDGLLALADDFYDDIRALPLEDDTGDLTTSFNNKHRAVGKFKRRKRKH